MLELLRILAPWMNDTKSQKGGTLVSLVALVALAIYAAQTLLLPAFDDPAPEPAPAIESAPAPQPAAPVAPLAPPVVDLDATPLTPDGTSDDAAKGLDE